MHAVVPPSPAAGPLVDPGAVMFWVADAGGELAGVRLWQEVGVRGDRLRFARGGDGRWHLRVARPAVDRMEYLFELTRRDGGRDRVLDPGNRRRVGGAFGEHSVVEWPEYAPPGWLTAPAPDGRRWPLPVTSRALGGQVEAVLWSPAGLADDEPAPLLVAHDGPEYDALASLPRYLSAGVTSGEIPRLRALLLAPGDRNAWYSANPAYAEALVTEVLPAAEAHVPVTVRVAMGASLGGLAALHAHRCHPGTFAGLFLQSTSFFTPLLDPQESRFAFFAAVTGFTGATVRATGDPAPVPTVLTCGTVEENLADNRLLAATLDRLGYAATLHEVRDAHNYTAWRDAFTPHLTGLLRAVAA